MRVDLHSHTKCSDGVLTPEALILRASHNGVDMLALTDHDTTSGLAEAQATAGREGLTLINGVEISVTWNKMLIHVLGLDIDPEYAPLQQGLLSIRETRNDRALEIAKRFDRLGIEGSYEGAGALATGEIISRTHFARFLIDKGLVKNHQDAFKRYLRQGKPAYVACEWASLADALGWIVGAGGIAVIAHPARYKLTRAKMMRLIEDFKAAGGRGIEVMSSSHSPADIKTMGEFAQSHDLLASCGSDFHDPDNAWVDLGGLRGTLPKDCQPVWHHFQS